MRRSGKGTPLKRDGSIDVTRLNLSSLGNINKGNKINESKDLKSNGKISDAEYICISLNKIYVNLI